jgi:hypothetical protein
MPSHGSARLMVASIQARTPGSPLGRGTLNDQNGSSAGGDLDPGASGQIGAFGLPTRVTDPHLAAAVLDRLFDEQRAANVLLTPRIKIGQGRSAPRRGARSAGSRTPSPRRARQRRSPARARSGPGHGQVTPVNSASAPTTMAAMPNQRKCKERLQDEQDGGEDEPIPGAEAREGEHGWHGVCSWLRAGACELAATWRARCCCGCCGRRRPRVCCHHHP